MKLLTKTKLIGGILSAIVLGAIGSGVWQYVMEPALSKSSKAILDLATLGVEAFKNDLYKEIATGFHEKASNALYFQLNLLFGFATVAIPLFFLIKTRELIQRKAALIEELQRIETGVEKKVPSIDELRESLRNTKPERLLKIVYATVLVGIIFFSAQFVISKREKYVNSAVTYYFHLKRIISPYIDQKELEELDSRFAQIQSANDYKGIIAQMSGVAEHSDVKIPKFEIWE